MCSGTSHLSLCVGHVVLDCDLVVMYLTINIDKTTCNTCLVKAYNMVVPHVVISDVGRTEPLECPSLAVVTK